MKLVLAASVDAYERWRRENQVPLNESRYITSSRGLRGHYYEDVVKLDDWTLTRDARSIADIIETLDAMRRRGDLC